jgi:multidrug efflux pump subunit AcrA (membrane-fusion protein)
MKKFLTLLILAALGGGGWYAYSHKMFGLGGPATANAATVAPTATAEIRDIDYSVLVSGDVLPLTQLDVKPEVGGRVKKLHIIPGEKVKAGQLLVEIDDRDILTERDTALRSKARGCRWTRCGRTTIGRKISSSRS